MNAQSAAAAYLHASIESAPPVKIVQLLYEGAVRYVDRARRCDPTERRSEFVDWVVRADAIVSELRLSLDHGPDERISRELERLYLYVEAQLAEALGERSVLPLEHARKVLAILGDAWSEIGLQTAEEA